MDTTGNEGRTYDEKEIAKLIQRASEIQAKAAGAKERSLSLDEVGEIAADLGLSIRSLQEAALELEHAPTEQRLSLTGATPVSHSRVADGVLTAVDWDKLLLELQRFSGSAGNTAELGAARTWSHSVGEGAGGINFKTTRVTVTPAHDHTAIQVQEEYGGAVVAYGMSFFFASIMTLMVAHSLPDVSKLAELVIAGSGGLASLGVVRALVAAGVSRQKQKLSNLADRLSQIVSRENAPSSDSVATPEGALVDSGPVLELDEEVQPEKVGASARSRTGLLSAILFLALTSPVAGQDHLLQRPNVVDALGNLEAHHAEYIEWQIRISEIPAPPFEETERAAFLASEFSRIGLEDVQTDAEGNVTGLRPGASDSILVLSAHLDTVFPPGTDVTVTREGSRLVGPGIADDAAGLMALMALATELDRAGLETNHSLLFVGTVGEEGLGDLRGVKHLLREGPYKDRIAAFVSVDGTSPTRIVHKALGSRRYRVTISGPGGHSWGAFGRVNPAHAMGAIIARFSSMPVPEDPKTTYNVGRIGGGTSVNSIPFEVWMEVDMRSTSQSSLGRIEKLFLSAVHQGVEAENLFRSESDTKLTVDPALIGDRPGGETSTDAAIFRAAAWATRAVGLEPDPAQSSTDSNIPISMGIPSVTIGAGGSSQNAHSLAEWYDPTDGHIGLQRALLMILAFDEFTGR